MTQPTTSTAAVEYDHNDECIGCGAHLADPCNPRCPFETGQISAATVLRGAAKRLVQHERRTGYDIPAAVTHAADDLAGATDGPILAARAIDALADHFDERVIEGSDLTGADLVRPYGVLIPRPLIEMTLYAVAAN